MYSVAYDAIPAASAAVKACHHDLPTSKELPKMAGEIERED